MNVDKTFHISKAKRNVEFYQKHKLRESGFNEWAATVLFYVCVHYVDAVLCADVTLNSYQRQPENHFARNHAVSKCSKLQGIAASYLNLYHRSVDARYKELTFSSNFLATLETNDYQPVRKLIRTHLGLT